MGPSVRVLPINCRGNFGFLFGYIRNEVISKSITEAKHDYYIGLDCVEFVSKLEGKEYESDKHGELERNCHGAHRVNLFWLHKAGDGISDLVYVYTDANTKSVCIVVAFKAACSSGIERSRIFSLFILRVKSIWCRRENDGYHRDRK